jgi:nitrate/nitrite transport system permease protein
VLRVEKGQHAGHPARNVRGVEDAEIEKEAQWVEVVGGAEEEYSHVAAVKREWLNVASTLEVRPLRKAFQVILPAAAPTIVTGMRISMGIAWLVIVAAEMLVGGTGIGYFVWNEWNNLSLPNVIFAILTIGLVGMLLDQVFARAQKAVTYAE